MMRVIKQYGRSSSLALGATFAGLLVIGGAFAAYFILVASEDTFTREADAAVQSEMRAARFADGGGANRFDAWFREALNHGQPGFFYALKSPGSNQTAGNLALWPEEAQSTIHEGLVTFTAAVGPDQSAHRTVIARLLTLEDQRVLLIGRDVTTLNFAQWFAQTFGWAMIGIFLVFAIASVIVGVYVAHRMNRIAGIADRIISTGNLSERVPIDSSWDDLSKLSVVLNKLLDELETMMHGVKSVSDSIAHDLRTPLTRLRGDFEELPASDLRTRLLLELDSILAIFTSLLRITAIETEKRKSDFTTVEMRDLIVDVADLYGPLAAEKDVSISTDVVEATTHGDRNLLFQLFANLVDNAVKFTPRGGRLSIEMKKHGGHVTVSVCDSGIGIPLEEREKVLKRFYRVDKSRSESGNGLGLAMVAAVVDLHDGRLELADGIGPASAPGLCCGVTLSCT